MRTLLVIGILFAAVLAGCTSKGGGHDDKFTCPNGVVIDLSDYPDHDNATFDAASKCPKGGGVVPKGNTTGNSTSRAPNVLPTLMFASKDMGGNVTNITVLNGNLTFTGMGSADSDGNITGMAMSVTDSNNTRTINLFDAATKTYPDVLVVFDRAGRVNVSVAVVDDRGGFATLETKIFVDEPQTKSPTFTGALPGALVEEFSECVGPLTEEGGADSGGGAIDPTYFSPVSFNVPDEASWIEAVTTGSALITICGPDPDGTAGPGTSPPLSDQGTDVSTDGTVVLAAANGVDNYNLGVYRTGGISQSISILVTVHYGPRPAPAA